MIWGTWGGYFRNIYLIKPKKHNKKTIIKPNWKYNSNKTKQITYGKNNDRSN